MEININELFGLIGTIVSIILYFSHIPTYFKFCLSYKKINLTPFHTILLNYISCVCWLIYSYFLKDKYLQTTNISGSIFSFICAFIYIIKLGNSKVFKSIIITISLLFLTSIFYILFVLMIKDIKIIGILSVITSLIKVISPILIIKNVIKYRNYKFISICKCSLGLLGTTSWIIYGFMSINFFIIIPNFIWMIFIFILMFLWNVFKKKKAVVEEVANYSLNSIRNRNDNIVNIDNI